MIKKKEKKNRKEKNGEIFMGLAEQDLKASKSVHTVMEGLRSEAMKTAEEREKLKEAKRRRRRR